MRNTPQERPTSHHAEEKHSNAQHPQSQPTERVLSLDFDGCLWNCGTEITVANAVTDFIIKIKNNAEQQLQSEGERKRNDANGILKPAAKDRICVEQAVQAINALPNTSEAEKQAMKRRLTEVIQNAFYDFHTQPGGLLHSLGVTKSDILMVGSNRQNMQSDQVNSYRKQIPSCFAVMEDISLKSQCKLDTWLTADIELLIDSLSSSKEATNDENNVGEFLYSRSRYAKSQDNPLPILTNSLPENEAEKTHDKKRHVFDHSKITQLYAQMHRRANIAINQNPNKRIDFIFVDDREDILQTLENTFSVYPYLIPENITLYMAEYGVNRATEDRYCEYIRSHRETPPKVTTQYKTRMKIQGTGTVDSNYNHTIQDLYEKTKKYCSKDLENQFYMQLEVRKLRKNHCNLLRSQLILSQRDKIQGQTVLPPISHVQESAGRISDSFTNKSIPASITDDEKNTIKKLIIQASSISRDDEENQPLQTLLEALILETQYFLDNAPNREEQALLKNVLLQPTRHIFSFSSNLIQQLTAASNNIPAIKPLLKTIALFSHQQCEMTLNEKALPDHDHNRKQYQNGLNATKDIIHHKDTTANEYQIATQYCNESTALIQGQQSGPRYSDNLTQKVSRQLSRCCSSPKSWRRIKGAMWAVLGLTLVAAATALLIASHGLSAPISIAAIKMGTTAGAATSIPSAAIGLGTGIFGAERLIRHRSKIERLGYAAL